MVKTLLLSAWLLALGGGPEAGAASLVDTAIERMGGEPTLRRVQRVRLEMITQWQRTSFQEHPYADAPSYEQHTELRDYTVPAWRNTRRFGAGGAWREVVDVVRDSVAIRRSGAAWAPLSAAYLDERRELFSFAPERLLLTARGAHDLRALPDTVIGGTPHARAAATVDRFPATLFFRRTDGFLAMARYEAAQPNDFGLAPWGVMEVEVWYSRWQKHPSGIVYPMQWDVRRVGRPYKRMTVLAADFDVPAQPDSFAVGDSLRTAFFETANRAMYDVPLDSARLPEPRLVVFGAPGSPAGAVKLGRRWVLLEAGVAPLSTERAVEWLRRKDPGSGIAAAVVTIPFQGNGGVGWLADRGVAMHVAPGARPFVETMLRNRRQSSPARVHVTGGGWLRVDGDSLWIEPLDLPDAPGASLVYVPSLRWVYVGAAISPLHQDLVMARIRERGWRVQRTGSMRVIARPVPTASQ